MSITRNGKNSKKPIRKAVFSSEVIMLVEGPTMEHQLRFNSPAFTSDPETFVVFPAYFSS